jgi:hypothetical protein
MNQAAALKHILISMRRSLSILLSCAVILIALAAPADARGGGGYGRGTVGDEHFVGGHGHRGGAHIKEAIEIRDKLLNTQLKSICRGC